MTQSFAKLQNKLFLERILLNKSSISFKILFPKNDSDKPPTIVIKIIEIKISIPGIAYGK